MKIIWNRVTKFSQFVAIVLFVAVFILAFQLGRGLEMVTILGNPINSANFMCSGNKSIYAEFFDHEVHVEFGSRAVFLPQTISGSGARYANQDESIVFWNKGNTAFITEGDPNNPTYKDCVIVKS